MKNKKKYPRVPVGIEDFEEIRKGSYCYSDKSILIEEIIEGSFKVALFARPRRFGKTLNLSMLRYFFDVNYQKPEGMGKRHLFEGLKIAKNEYLCNEHMNKYPVISLSFKGIKYKEHNLFLDHLREFFAFEFKKFRYLLNSPISTPKDKLTISNLLSGTASEAELCMSIKLITNLLEEHHKEKVYLFIDEYDAPIHFAYSHGTYRDCADFFSVLYGNALKGNSAVEKVVMTGILRVSKESIFSDVNNVSVFTVLETNYSPYFGFLEHEVKTLVESYDLQDQLPQVQTWYNGYRFGNNSTGIYNPWSILQWLANEAHELKPYWVNTSKNDIIRTLYLEQKHSLKPEFFDLFLGKSIKAEVNTETTFDANLTQNPAIFWGFMLQTGYLTVTDKIFENNKYIYTLKIPNEEIHIVFRNMVDAWFETLSKDLKKPNLAETISQALVQRKLEIFYKNLQQILIQTMSYHDFNRNPENAFHAFMAGFMVWLTGNYDVRSNRESGIGRYDLCLIPKKESIPAYLFEFKSIAYLEEKAPSAEKIEQELKLALKQIDTQLYETELESRGVRQITKVALVFYGKQVWMEYK
ncbi:MAG: AAA family ATPase [Bdellovibrionota bacterium]